MKYYYLNPAAARYEGMVRETMDFTLQHQLLDPQTWKQFVQVYRDDSDDHDMGWRCEYWGKMMRGAVMTYEYTGDEALYSVLDCTMRDLLTTARSDGRFSTYSDEKQLSGGWDVWGRKYILSGSLYFYRICKDDVLKQEILSAMMSHADALLAHIGPEEDGKTSIFKTSTHWLGVNSCSILESILDLYRTCGESRYLDFASYIIHTGGCEEADLIDLALEGKLMPYQYPETKAYETMSFFEGVLAYGDITGESRYVEAALRFMEAVYQTDITVIGCSGCTHELFDHSSEKQIEPPSGTLLMQETCVTVTWLRCLDILFRRTGEIKYLDRMERSIWNALYGAVNTHMQDQYYPHGDEMVAGFPFISYSPLFDGRRGYGIGGFKKFSFGGSYGCCVCIASAGFALAGLCGALRGEDDSLLIGMYHPGRIETGSLSLQCCNTLLYEGEVTWTVTAASSQPQTLSLRLAEYLDQANLYLNKVLLSVNGDDCRLQNGILSIRRIWSAGDTLVLHSPLSLRSEMKEAGSCRKIALTYGPLVLCRDAVKDIEMDYGSIYSYETTTSLTYEERDRNDLSGVLEPVFPLQPLMMSPEPGELLRLGLPLEDGEILLLSDYQSCGKDWLSRYNHVTVWHSVPH